MKIIFKIVNQFLGTAMSISLNGVECAWLGKGEEVTIDAPEGVNKIKIKGFLREKNITIEAKQDVTITAKWNRISGKIDTLVTGADVKIIA